MLKVMIVDNETAIRKGLVYCIRWETLDCQIVAQAEDGIDALEKIPKTSPDVVISDIRMPGMDGLELARRLSEDWPQIKVILLTGFPDFKYAQRAIEYRVVDFVLKPASIESLTSAIEKVRTLLTEERSSRSLRQELQSQSEQTLLLERSIFLHDLIRKVRFSHLFVLNRAAQLGLNLSGYYVLFLYVSPLSPDSDGESELLSELDQAQKILTDCLSELPLYFITHSSQSSYAVVCAPESAPIQELCNEAVDIADSLPRFSFSIGISLHANDPLAMARAAEQAEQAMQFAQYSPDRTVKRFDQIPSIPKEVTEHIFSDLRLIKSAIENRSHTAASDIMRRLFAFIRQNKLPIKTVRNICIYIYNFCTSLLFAPNGEGDLAEDKLPSLKELLESGSAETLEQNMLAFAERMLGFDATRPADAESIIRTIKDYIAQHYAEELSLESLAAQVYLSPSYMSKFFKRETGENLSTYIQKVRIDEANILLRTTGLKTYEVANRVGISDPAYFSRIFKKLTGIKPKDFRSSGS